MSFTVYRSSAGSGKTYTLVREYLGIVLKNPDAFRNILAITFTNKAANEMRERILSSLKEISDPQTYRNKASVKYMLPDLMSATGLDQEKLKINAAEVLRLILHHYQDFSVSTIDSFVHRIIRTFAFDLHLPLNFEVEMDEDAMVGMAVDLLLGRVGMDKLPTDILLSFAESRIDEEKNWDIERDLKSFAGKLLKDDIAEYLPLLENMDTGDILGASRHMIRYTRDFEKEAREQASRLMKIWNDNDIGPADLYQGRSGVYGFVSRIAEGNFSKLELNSKAMPTLTDCKWTSSRPGPVQEQAIKNHMDEMNRILGHLAGYAGDHRPRYVLYTLLKRNIFQLAVLHEIGEILGQIRQSEGIIHISEFDKRIAGVVENEPVPFIYERLGDRYRHFLIDEFQDTSVLEWQNILPLIENSLAEAHFNMVVGDAKQAIYRFKGGEVEQLVKLPEIHKKPDKPEMLFREKQLTDHYRAMKLRSNYRSARQIIEFNNDLYTHISTKLPPSISGIYEDCYQDAPDDSDDGEVRISFIDAEGNKTDLETIYFDRIRSYIREMKDKGFALRDIAILTRSNIAASKIARYLLVDGISVVSAESLLLSSSPEVNFLVNCLDFVANREDKLALSVMLSYLSNTGSDDLHLLLSEMISRGDSAGSLRKFRDWLTAKNIDFSPVKLNQMGLFERVEEMVRLFSLDKSPDPYITFFLDVVFEYAANRRFLDEDFTAYWRDNSRKYSIIVPEGLNAVNVMTVHKAKGLEFPVVIFPFANSRVDISRDQKWVKLDEPEMPGLKVTLIPLTKALEETQYADVYREEEEKALLDMLNIMYVATTRPTSRLLIICDKPGTTGDQLKSMPSVFRSFLEAREMWDDSKDNYSFGEDNDIVEENTPEGDQLSLGEFISGDWRDHIRLSGKALERWDLAEDTRNMLWGNLVHNILSAVRDKNDIDGAMRKEILNGNLSEGEKEKIARLLQDVVQMPDLQSFFDGTFEVKNEAAIMTDKGREYRPDRIMIRGEQAIVLDYKTGKEDPEHLKQVQRYAELLEEIGFRPVEKYLLYINDPCKLIRV